MKYQLLAAVLISACSSDTAPTEHAPTAGSEYRQVDHGGKVSDQASFIETRWPPIAPPSAELRIQTRDGNVPVPGILYTSDWVTRESAWNLSPKLPVPWPEAIHVNEAKRSVLVLKTSVPPDWLVMNTYATVDLVTGEPRSDRTGTFECSAFSGRRCHFDVENGIVTTSWRPGEFPVNGYITVFSSWYVPLAARTNESPGQVSAAWLFRLSR